jgi:hypothetical protein
VHAKTYNRLVARVAALLDECTEGQDEQFAAAFKSLLHRMATVSTKLDNATVKCIVSSSLRDLCVCAGLSLQGCNDVAEGTSYKVASAFALALLESIAVRKAPVMTSDDAFEVLGMIHCRYLCPMQSNGTDGPHLGFGAVPFSSFFTPCRAFRSASDTPLTRQPTCTPHCCTFCESALAITDFSAQFLGGESQQIAIWYLEMCSPAQCPAQHLGISNENCL